MHQKATVHTKKGLLAALELANTTWHDTKIILVRKSGVTHFTITGRNMNEFDCDRVIKRIKSGIRRIKAADLTA